MEQILTARLLLVAATREIAQAELAADQKFGALLRAEIPPGWPPPLNDQESLNWFFKLIDHPGYLPGWGMWYFVNVEDSPRAIGNGGFKGPPDAEGSVEIGYSILPAHQRLGFGGEAVEGLLRWAFAHEGVTRVIAHTLPDLTPSIRVLERVGFAPIGPGEESGTICFELKADARRSADELRPPTRPQTPGV